MNQIRQLFQPYFAWLDDKFGSLAKEALRHNIGGGEIARGYLSDPSRRQKFYTGLMPVVCDYIEEFWECNGDLVRSQIGSLPCLKARFGGDVGPQVSDRLFERSGLYFDTIIVPDPLFKIAKFPTRNKTKDYYILKYAINQVLYKDIFLADVTPPIAVLVPDAETAQPSSQMDQLADLARIDCIALVNKLYEKSFDEFEEVQRLFSSFRDINQAAREIVLPELLFLDEDTPLEPEAQVEAYLRKESLDWELSTFPDDWQGANRLLLMFISRMMQGTDLLNRAALDNANPIVSAPVSFHWMSQKIKLNQSSLAEAVGIPNELELHKTNALLSQQLNWLGNVSQSDLIELRKKGRLSELRTIISMDIDKLSNVPIINAEQVVNQIDYNLSTALERHQEKVQELDKSFRTELAVSGTTLMFSALGALQPALGTLLPYWLPAAVGAMGAVKLKDVIVASSKYLRESKTLHTTPTGILWTAKEKSKSDEK